MPVSSKPMTWEISIIERVGKDHLVRGSIAFKIKTQPKPC